MKSTTFRNVEVNAFAEDTKDLMKKTQIVQQSKKLVEERKNATFTDTISKHI